MRRRYTVEERHRLVSEVQATGESAAAVAKRLGVTPSSAYLWLKEARADPRPPAFARVVKSSSSTGSRFVVVEVGGATVRVEPGFDGDLLRGVVAALGGGT